MYNTSKSKWLKKVNIKLKMEINIRKYGIIAKWIQEVVL